MYASLSDFVVALEEAGELRRITRPVDPVLELAAIVELESKSRAPNLPSDSACANDPRFHDRGGQALLFENVVGSDVPVLANAFGSYNRMEMALGCHADGHTPGGFDAIARKIASLTKPVPPRTFGELWTRGKEFLPLLRIPPKTVSSAPCQEVVIEGHDIDLTRLPIPRCWPHDGDYAALGYPPGINDGVEGIGHPTISGEEWAARWRGRYITFAGIHTIHAKDAGDPKPASHNIGMYRVQLMGKRLLAMHWHMHHDGASHWRSHKAKGQAMPVAIVLGGESVLPYAATCPLPPGISELLMAGFLNDTRGISLVPCKTVPLRVPANAEIVIEGWVSPDADLIGWDPRDAAAGSLGGGAVFEGPFGDHTGFYSMPDRYPQVLVTAVTMRKKPVFPFTLVGLPPQEDYYLGKATERVMGALLKVVVHDVDDYDLPMFGAFHNCAFMRVHKHYPMQARRLMHSVWGTGQMAWTKSVFVVDHDVDCHDVRAVMTAAAHHCRPSRDIERVSGPVDILDHAAPHLGTGVKIGFDCTRKLPAEGANGVPVLPDEGPRRVATADDAAPHLARVRAIDGVVGAAVSPQAPGWLFVQADRAEGEPERAGIGARVRDAVLALNPAADGVAELPFVVIVGRDAPLDDEVLPLFHWLAHMDVGRDAVLVGDRIGFDATAKSVGDARPGWPVRAWPPIVRHPEDVLERARAEVPASGPAAPSADGVPPSPDASAAGGEAAVEGEGDSAR